MKTWGRLGLWGQHRDEYQAMFALPVLNADTRVLEYGAGMSAVNAEVTAEGGHWVSCDPLYALDAVAITARAALDFEAWVMDRDPTKSRIDFSYYGGFEAFIAQRRQGLLTFLADYETGKAAHRYLALSTLPRLPFADFTFDWALSAYHLLTDVGIENLELQLQHIRELARVAKEVRIYPLINEPHHASPLLGPVLLALQQQHFGVEVREVDYPLQLEGRAMLRIWAQQCQLGGGV